MPVVGRGNEHRVDIFAVEQLAIVHVTVALADTLCPRDPAFVHIADGQHLDVILDATLDQAANMPGAHAADADDAHVDAVVGAKHLRGGKAGNRHGADGGGGGFDEIATRGSCRCHGRLLGIDPKTLAEHAEGAETEGVGGRRDYASNSSTTRPETSVSRWSRPPWK